MKSRPGIVLTLFSLFLILLYHFSDNSTIIELPALKASGISAAGGQDLAEDGRSITFVSIPEGSFQMGGSTGYGDERPVHAVTLGAFRISATEITNIQYAAFLNEALAAGEITATNAGVTGVTGPYSGKPYLDLSGSLDPDNECWISFDGYEFSVVEGMERYPVVYVTWYGADAFAAHYEFRLPTEAEWEYAARGGEEDEYGTDDGTINSDNANYNKELGYPTEAGSYPANLFGLFDMAGNVWEWCNDWYDYKYYQESPGENPAGPDSGSSRVLRGGSWHGSKYECRSAFRYKNAPDFNRSDIGFRVVRK